MVRQNSGTGAVFSTWPAEQRVSQRNGARAHAFKPSTAVLLQCCGESTVWFHQELRKSPVTETNSLYIVVKCLLKISFGCAYILVAGWFCTTGTTARVDPCRSCSTFMYLRHLVSCRVLAQHQHYQDVFREPPF